MTDISATCRQIDSDLAAMRAIQRAEQGAEMLHLQNQARHRSLTTAEADRWRELDRATDDDPRVFAHQMGWNSRVRR